MLLRGQLVVSRKTQLKGIIVKRSAIHKDFWKVFSQGKINDWHISNIEENKVYRVNNRDI